jgi:hypothetical protein
MEASPFRHRDQRTKIKQFAIYHFHRPAGEQTR